jgi:hypothetical protein
MLHNAKPFNPADRIHFPGAGGAAFLEVIETGGQQRTRASTSL